MYQTLNRWARFAQKWLRRENNGPRIGLIKTLFELKKAVRRRMHKTIAYKWVCRWLKLASSTVNTVLSWTRSNQHVPPRAATRSLQIPSSTSLPLVKLGQNRYEPPASRFAKSQTDWPFGWSAKRANRSNHNPA